MSLSVILSAPGVILSEAKDLLLPLARATLRIVPMLAIACTGSGTGDGAGSASAASAPAPPATYGLGRPVDSAALARIDIDVNPTGATLPEGHGTAITGYPVYVAKCAMCHGAKGEGIAPAPKLVGRDPREGFPFGRDPKAVKTVGNYWPHSTTLYDYIHRAMPLPAPGTLRPDEVYGVVAWILAENEIIARDAEMNRTTLPAVKMPAAGRFVVDDRAGKTVK